ncbi:TPA: FAA hydrolase family protein [Candidatus Poribacteria bacterium]|nr:FAA hydrolase family protein [Candidatus Poribacteria bacterium]HIB89331.1 FAA hydrolase family protein [Candidatus Poribacteria bacterium]HIC00047.1 FAA hydrolase family protein [Candidatus Poribacteria bacterium]HIC17452.1 FAA hydrolase family protein [Candidatus Poribacteria bacterium]HIM10709.1 FAA hydrolase family protein [Candidatus Poribacteria bacterium]
MLLFRFGEKDQEKPGVVIGEAKKDCSGHFTDWNREFFNNNGLEALKSLVADKGEDLPDVPDGTRYGSCVARPGTLMCIGLNYSDHAEESGMEPPSEPVIFQKVSNAVIGPYDDVIIPKGSRKTDWEVELGVVIGRDALYLDSIEEAEDYIAGYCVSQDVSEREFQLEREGQWTKGKSCPTFNPLGPYLYPASDIGDANNLTMELKVNEEIKQNGNTKNMIFNPSFLVHYLSQFMLLEAGDVLSTGTPAGVGAGMNPPQFLRDGDVVELSIEKLGTQKQTFRAY